MRVSRELFYWDGIHATGVDRIASEAAVASTTLYRQFASKDQLAAAYVEREGQGYREWFDGAVHAADRDPRAQILAVFDALAEQVREPDECRGCPFLMALAELPDPDHPAHQQAVTFKQWVRMRFGELTTELAETTSLDDPEVLADQLSIIMDGVYASVQALGADGPAKRARELVEQLIADRD